MAKSLLATGAVVATGVAAADIATSLNACYQSPVLKIVQSLDFLRHPCESLPTFSPAGDVREAAEHKLDAVEEDPRRMALQYASVQEVEARPFPRGWVSSTTTRNPDASPDRRSSAPRGQAGLRRAAVLLDDHVGRTEHESAAAVRSGQPP